MMMMMMILQRKIALFGFNHDDVAVQGMLVEYNTLRDTFLDHVLPKHFHDDVDDATRTRMTEQADIYQSV